MRRLKALYTWFDSRLQLGAPIKEMALHPVPNKTASWWYVFGSAAFVLLMLQIVTGILLALVYVPSAGQAWNSLNVLNHQLTLGWFLRAMHGWGSNFMVAVVLIHMTQVFLFGAYKFPRELTWILGVFLLLMTLGMAFTGQVLRFDQDAYWGLGIGASIASRVPFIGNTAGPHDARRSDHRRRHAVEIFCIACFRHSGNAAGIRLHSRLDGTQARHQRMANARPHRSPLDIRHGIPQLTKKDGRPFVPGAVWKDAFFSAAILAAVAVCAAVFGPYGPGGQPDPTIIQTAPKPDFFFLWLYAALSYLPPEPRNTISADCSRTWNRGTCGPTVLCGRR